jgi:dCTP diphosphatase
MTPDFARLTDLLEQIRRFNEDRDWDRFHNPKDLAIALSVEAAEVLEHFQWKSPEAMAQHLQQHKDDIADELADTLYYLLMMADKFDIDLVTALHNKMEKNETKYPIQTVLRFQQTKGRFGKYNEL